MVVLFQFIYVFFKNYLLRNWIMGVPSADSVTLSCFSMHVVYRQVFKTVQAICHHRDRCWWLKRTK